MCHIIASAKNCKFIYAPNKQLIGQKIFDSSLITRPVYYSKGEYYFQSTNDGIDVLSQVNEQDISFNLTVAAEDGDLSFFKKGIITTGMHISQIVGMEFYLRDDRISLPVAFNLDDISVSKLTLLYPDKLKTILQPFDTVKQLNRLKICFQGGFENWISEYEKWFGMVLYWVKNKGEQL